MESKERLQINLCRSQWKWNNNLLARASLYNSFRRRHFGN